MLDRLKSLPLTIILTVLIWMYAESQVNSARSDTSLTVAEIAVWVSGPPGVLGQNDVVVEPKTVSVTVTGTVSLIETLQKESPGQTGIHAYLDITQEDRPSMLINRSIRFVTPTGVSVLQGPERVGFRLVPKASTVPGTGPG